MSKEVKKALAEADQGSKTGKDTGEKKPPVPRPGHCPDTVHFHFDLSGISSGADCSGKNRLEIFVHVTFACRGGLPPGQDDHPSSKDPDEPVT